MSIKIEKLNKQYNSSIIFEDTNIKFGVGINFLIGKNGIGKTTLFNILYKEDVEYEGNIYIGKENLKDIDKLFYKSNVCSYVTQNDNLFEDLQVVDNINILAGSYDKKYLNELLINLNIEDTLKKKYKKLSGGQKQKVKIIISLLKDTPIILIDEMENNLDVESIEYLYTHLKELNKILIIVTHNSIDELKELYNINNFSLFEIRDKKIKPKFENNILNEELKIDFSTNSKANNHKFKPINKLLFKFNIYIFLIIGLSILLVFLNILPSLSDDVNSLYSSVNEENIYDDDIVVLYPPLFNPFFYGYADNSWLEKTPYYFSIDDKLKIEQNQYVEDVLPLVTEGMFVTDIGPNIEVDEVQQDMLVFDDLDMTEVNYNKYNILSSENLTLNIQMTYPTVPKKISENMNENITGTFVDEIYYGEVPKDNTNEVMIDEYTAAYFAQKMNLNSLEELVGKTIIFTTHKESPNDKSEDNYKGEYKVKVSGIYGQTYKKGEAGYIYRSYSDKGYIVEHEQIWNMSQEENLKEAKGQIGFMYDAIGLEEPTIEQIKESGEYKYPGFYIKLKNKEDVSKFIDDLQEYNPYLSIKANYLSENENNYKYVKKSLLKNLLYILLLLLITFIGMGIFIRYYLLEVNTTINTLLFYGLDIKAYLNKNKVKLFLFCILEIMVLLLYEYFKYGHYFTNNLFFYMKFILVYFIIFILIYIFNEILIKKKRY